MPDTEVTKSESVTSLGGDEQRVLEKYVQLVSKMDVVQEVLVERDPDGINIWAIIDAEPLAFAPRKPVYDAELQAAHAAPGTSVFFRLINQREHLGEGLNHVLPTHAHLAWRRVR